MKLSKSLHWLIIFLFPLGCARQTAPTGGPKDSIPPTLVTAIPKSGTKNFRQQLIQLEFNEAIILNNPKEQIIITPDVQKKYDITARKNKIKLEFEETLKDTTTYAIHFRGAVQDITEKNPAVNLKIAFSTGPFIDSLSIKGTIYNPLETKEPKAITVALFQQDTFNIFKHKPVYITQSDDKGIFSIENLKAGKYYIYAMDDKNRNIIADSKTELYGFIPQPITLTQNQTNIKIPLQKLDARALKLINARPYNTYFNIKTSKSIVEYKLQTENNIHISSSLTDDPSSIKVYNNLNLQEDDSLKVKFVAHDSINNEIDTTLYVKFLPRKSKPEALNVKIGSFQVLADKGQLLGEIQFSKPIVKVNYDSIFYSIDSLNTIHFEPGHFTWDSLTNKLSITRPFDKILVARPEDPKAARQTKRNYELTIGAGAFVGVENDSSKQQPPTSIKPLYYEDTGVLILKIETAEPKYIVELLDKDFKVIRSVADKKNISFEDLPPGDYQIRLVIDKNGDGKWTPGNFESKQPAEPTVFYKTEKKAYLIKLKANFEIGPLLITF
jgi:uncharacterized protein (DUF2141 family)